MKKTTLFIALISIFLFSSCLDWDSLFFKQEQTIPQQQITTLSNLDQAKEGRPEYTIKIFNDPDVVNLITALTTQTQTSRDSDISQILEEFVSLSENTINILNTNQNASHKLEELRILSRNIRSETTRHNIQIKLEGAAKDTVIQNLQTITGGASLTTSREIIVDYRDIAPMLYTVELLCLYKENATQINNEINRLIDYITQTNSPFNATFENKLTTLLTTEEEFSSESFWNQFNLIFKDIAAIQSPLNIMRLNDILNSELLSLPNIDTGIQFINLLFAFAKDVCEFEILKTDEIGRTTYTSLYQLLYIPFEEAEEPIDISLFKTALTKAFNEPAYYYSPLKSRDVETELNILINGKEITEDSCYLDIINAIAPGYFNETIDFSYISKSTQINPSTNQFESITTTIGAEINLSEISNLPLNQTNIAINNTLIEKLIQNEIWLFWAQPFNYLTEQTFSVLSNIIDSDVDFVNLTSTKAELDLEFGGNNGFACGIEVEGLTIFDVITMLF